MAPAGSRPAPPRSTVAALRMALCVAQLPACGGLADLPARALVGPFPGPLGGRLDGRRDHPAPEGSEPIAVRAPDGVELRGYLLPSRAPRGGGRGVMIFLHGLGGRAADFEAAALDATRAGFDAVAWDGRGHGESGGHCTWGAREPRDLSAVLASLAARGLPVERTVLFGYSVGAVVALQAAAVEPRVRAVIAVAPLASLDLAVARVARAAPPGARRDAVAAAERTGGFRSLEVRPVAAAARLAVPLLLVAGSDDRLAPPGDAAAIARAAGSRARLLIVEGADHSTVMSRCGPLCDAALADLLQRARLAP